MSTIESENSARAESETAPTKVRRKPIKKVKPSKRAAAKAKKPAKEKAARANKKAQVIAMMQRAKGAALAEIMKETGWQAHTVRGFVSVLASKGGHKVESSKSESGERTYRIVK